jgi:hypothetical protein
MRLRRIRAWLTLLVVLPTIPTGVAQAATLAELAGWCAPEGGSEQLCRTYLSVILEGLGSTDPIMHGGNRRCVPPEADRAQIIRLVRAYASQSGTANDIFALDGVGAALKGRYPCS